MAHSDVLIFLTNITWIFFLFLLSYFFFVTFFLPSFYKTVRIRTLVRRKNTIASAIYIRELLGLQVFSADFLVMLKEIFSSKISQLGFIFLTKLSPVFTLNLSTYTTLNSSFVVGFKKYVLAKVSSTSTPVYVRFTTDDK